MSTNMLLATFAALALALAVVALALWMRSVRSNLVSLAHAVMLLDRRVDRCDGALGVEVRRIDALESELSEHLQDPLGVLSQPPRL